jgi:hypothetical protein
MPSILFLNPADIPRAAKNKTLHTPIEPGSRLIREGLTQLLDDPTGGRMGRNVEIHDTPPIVADDEDPISC